MITITVDVKDSTSKLANTKMKFYYAVVDSDETGIIFEDENLYKPVKSQLTAKQTENEELDSYGSASTTTLYKRAYDVPFILVIDTNTLINEIPSLILNDKRVTDLTGIEEFVGLDTELNLSYNYIDTIEKIVELEKNKDAKEAELQARYSKALETVKTNRTNLITAKEAVKTLTKQMEDKEIEIGKVDTSKEGSAAQIEALTKEWNALSEKKADEEQKVAKYTDLVSKGLEKLYTIYQKEYKLTTLLPVNVNRLSVEDLYYNTDLATAKSYAESIMNRISELEKSEALTSTEKTILINTFSIPTTKTVVEKNPTTGAEEEKEKDIENPITEYFNTEKEGAEYKTLGDYQDFIIKLKYIDTVDQAINYCLINRMGEDSTVCHLLEGLEEIKKELTSKNLDTTIIDNVIAVKNNEGTLPTGLTALVNLVKTDCNGETSANDEYVLSGKLVKVTTEEISTYITLPRIQKLNMEDNKISELTGLEELSELKDLNMYKNTLKTIENVDWSTFSILKNLNLGYNQLSKVKVLEVIKTLEKLNLSRNLLSGNFDFYLAGMKDLKEIDFSYNQYTNIAYLINQYTFIAKSYNMQVGDYLTSEHAPKISFKNQTLTMSTTIIKDGDFATIDLPRIFAQFEQIDYSRTSFGETSNNGTVLADGTAVVLRTPTTGTYRGIVTVEGNNGNSYTTDGIGYGTTCVIDYTVAEKTVEPEPDDPTNPDQPVVETPDYGYTVADGYVFVATPETKVEDFVKRLVSTDDYSVKVVSNNHSTLSGNIATGSVVSIDTKDGEEVAILEIVVKGDINGDGDIDALDSGVIRNVINDAEALVGVYSSAADVNNDGEIDSLDSLLILQYRADKISSFED